MQFLNQIWQFDLQSSVLPAILFASGAGLFFLLAAVCGPLLGAGAEFIHAVSRKAFYDKCALQINQTAFVSAVFIAAPLIAAFFLGILRPLPFPARDTDLFAAANFKILAPLGLFLAFILFFLLYLRVWSTRGPRPLRFCAGLCSSLASLLLLVLGLLFFLYLPDPEIALLLDTDPTAAILEMLENFAFTRHLWPAPLYLLGTGLGAAASLARVWLIWRRRKADYGRDYYLFAMRGLARAAFVLVPAATGAGVWLFFSLENFIPLALRQTADPVLALLSLGLPLLCCALHLAGAVAENPMRHKAGSVLASLCLLGAFCSQLTLLFNSYPAA
ncbi:MAG: hypothetical protein LBN33_11130 [Desulfovibrio sp.]|jgi:uncharacterized membrane protein|nr:hypothetical protein [Desulfovibrio sp.]